MDVLKRIFAPLLTHFSLRLGDVDKKHTEPALMWYESAVIPHVNHLEAGALHFASYDDFELLIRKFGNIKGLHLDEVRAYGHTHSWRGYTI